MPTESTHTHTRTGDLQLMLLLLLLLLLYFQCIACLFVVLPLFFSKLFRFVVRQRNGRPYYVIITRMT